MEDAQRKRVELVFALADKDANSRWYRLQEVDPRLHKILSPSFFDSNRLCAQLSALSEVLVKKSAYFGAAMIALSSERLLRNRKGYVVVALYSSLGRGSGFYLWELGSMAHKLTGGKVKIEFCENEPYSAPTQGAMRLLWFYPITDWK
jgi:hypothetical protein